MAFDLMGLLGGAQPQQTPQVDPQTGFMQGDMQRAAMGQMGQLGMLLMAAGQNQTADQRARILAAGAGFAGDNSASMQRFAQARAMADTYQNAQLTRARENAALQSVLADPSLSPQEKQYAAADLRGFLANRYNVENRAPDEYERYVEALKGLGMGPDEIRKALLERYGGSTKKAFSWGVADTTTGEGTPWRIAGQTTPAPSPQDNEPPAGVPVNPKNAFGVEGTWDWLTRNIRGVVGGGTEEQQRADRQKAADVAWLKTFKNTADDVLSETFDGKKTNYTIKRASIVANPEQFWTSATEAQGHTKLISQMSGEELANVNQLLADPRIASNKTMYAKMQIKRQNLMKLKKQADALLDTFGVNEQMDPVSAASRFLGE